MRKVIILFLIFLCAEIQASSKYETRAVWLTTLYGLDWPNMKANSPQTIKKQQEELCQILDQLQNANFNTILFQTRLRGDVIYPSKYENFDEALTGQSGKNPGYDPLKFAVEECHKRGMEIHAWMVTIPISNTTSRKKNLNTAVFRTHPELCKLYRGKWYLDPGHPKTKEYLSKIAKEIVSQYDVDGIHLDYIRYPEKADKFPDWSTYKKYGNHTPLKQWRKDNITAIVRAIYHDVKKIKPWVKVSSSPVGKYDNTQRYRSKGWNAYHAVYQDAQLWMKEGIHDILFPMMYFRNNDFYPFALDWNENCYGRQVVPGLGIYFMHPREKDWELNEILRQIEFLRNNRLEGQAYFRAQFLTDNTKGIMTQLCDRVYRYPAFPSPMLWADSIAPASPINPSAQYCNGELTLSWDMPTAGNHEEVIFRLYASSHFPVDVNNSQNIYRTAIRSKQILIGEKENNHLYWAVTAADRFGNESTPLSINQPSNTGENIYKGQFPSIKCGENIAIYNLEGILISTLNHTQCQLKPQLPKGIYRIVLIDTNGNHLPLGLLLP